MIVLAVALVIAELAFVFGAAWDIQWHYAIGRDRPFIPPHVLLLGGIATTGALALGGVLWSTFGSLRPSRPGADATPRVRLFGLFRAPVGLYFAGLGALCSALAFPWDDYWHRLYGLDVTIWAPFHVMIIGGMALAALGATYLFTSYSGRFAAAGTAVGLATGAAVLLLLQAQALDHEGIISVRPRAAIAFPPLLIALTIPWLTAASFAVRITLPGGRHLPGARGLRGLPGGIPIGATLAALVLTAVRLALFAFVPWALRWAAPLEGARVREQNMAVVATPYAFPAWIVVAALVIDGACWLVRSRRLERVRLGVPFALLVAGAIAGIALALLDRPWERTLPLVRNGRQLDLRAALVNALPIVAAIGAVAALYGAAIGRALASLSSVTHLWSTRRARYASVVLHALALALVASAAWSGYLAAQGLIGPAHPPLIPFLPARPVTSPSVGWVIGLVPAWGLLAFILAESLALRPLRGLRRASSTSEEGHEDHRLDQGWLRLVRRGHRPPTRA